MIEQSPPSAEADAVSYPSDQNETFESRPIGEYLRRQRILRGMSAEDLARLTRIPLRSLERLESGQFDGETDGFVRGFVRTVANALGLDADDAVSRMLREPTTTAWERRSPGRGQKQILVGLSLLILAVVTIFVMRAGWNILLGDASTPDSREVVLWHDPVRALAEATGDVLDPADGIALRSRPDADDEMDSARLALPARPATRPSDR